MVMYPAAARPLALAIILLCLSSGETGPLDVMRAARCIIPNGLEHLSRAAFLQQCISHNYGQGNETRCYPELGCFPMDSPWTSMLRPFPTPLHPAEIDVRLYCYTRDSPQRFNITLWPTILLGGCPFDAAKRTAFLTHGFANSGNDSWVSQLKDLYLKAEDANFFVVDWGHGAKLLNYLQVASNTRIAGAELARFLKYLKEQEGLSPGSVHLLGHSLGAHISAYAAKAVPGCERITALDPAQPGFEGQDNRVRLDKEDAGYVEVVHTNAAPFLPTLGFGLILPAGHVDFYMNGGLLQPGCHMPNLTNVKITSIQDLKDITVEALSTLVSCSHGRACDYYMDVLKSNCTIWGRLATVTRHILNAGTLGYIEPLFSKLKKCSAKTCIPLGLETPNFKARGTFAATTNKNEPYCETNYERNQRILGEIEEIVEETTEKVVEALKTAADKGKDAAVGVVGVGKTVATGVVGKLGKIVSFG